jgi:uncharacterized membrane protein
MVDKNQIEQWLKEGTITKEQAQKMLADTSQYKKEQSSNKLIIALSTIGAILLGIGVILFIASNWQQMPNIVKVLILLGSTAGSYYGGYVLKYQRKTLVKVGASLIFLGALLFGATIFLIAQMYHINANSHTLILIWLIGIIPLVYALKTEPIARLASLLFFIWIGLFVFRNMSFERASRDFFGLPVLYLVSGVLFFGIGGLHYLSDDLKAIARVYRIAGIKISMWALFLLTFRFFSGHYGEFNIREGLEFSSQFTAGFIIFSILTIILMAINLFFNPTKSETSILEGSIGLGLSALALIFFFYPATTNIYVVLFNLILMGLILTILFIGYNREDMKLVNIGIAYLWILVVVRYCDFFWKLLPRSIFFMVGGLILVLGSIALERKRRQLKQRFGG